MAAILVLGVLGAIVGAAAGLALTTTTLGASRVTPSRCASTGLTVTPTLTGATWTAVVVGGIPATCGGATLQLTVDTAVTNSSGSAVVPAGGGSATVTLAVAQAVVAAMQVDLVFVGP